MSKKKPEQAKRTKFRQGSLWKNQTKGRQHLRGKGRRQRLQRIRNARMINAKPQAVPPSISAAKMRKFFRISRKDCISSG